MAVCVALASEEDAVETEEARVTGGFGHGGEFGLEATAARGIERVVEVDSIEVELTLKPSFGGEFVGVGGVDTVGPAAGGGDEPVFEFGESFEQSRRSVLVADEGEAVVECASSVGALAGVEAGAELAVPETELFGGVGEGVGDLAEEVGGLFVAAGAALTEGEFSFGAEAAGLSAVVAVAGDPAPEFGSAVVGKPFGGVAGAPDSEVEGFVDPVGAQEIFEAEFFGLGPELAEAVGDAAAEVSVALFAQVAIHERARDIMKEGEGVAPRVDVDAPDESEFAELLEDGPHGAVAALFVVEFLFQNDGEEPLGERQGGDAQDFDQKLLSSVEGVESPVEEGAESARDIGVGLIGVGFAGRVWESGGIGKVIGGGDVDIPGGCSGVGFGFEGIDKGM